MSLNIRFRALKSSGATKSYARTLLTQPIILKRTIHSSLSAVSRSCDLSLLFTSSLLLSQLSDICPIYEHNLDTPLIGCSISASYSWKGSKFSLITQYHIRDTPTHHFIEARGSQTSNSYWLLWSSSSSSTSSPSSIFKVFFAVRLLLQTFMITKLTTSTAMEQLVFLKSKSFQPQIQTYLWREW